MLVGIDGCKAGWVAAVGSLSDIHFILGSNISELLNEVGRYSTIQQNHLFLVDMPIGLTTSRPRQLEGLARGLLGSKASSIFSVPAMSAVYADGYEAACSANLAAFGKKISLQSFYLCQKIRQIDTFLKTAGLKSKDTVSSVLKESHPELNFHLLHGRSLKYSKKTPEGIEERLGILSRWIPQVAGFYEQGLTRFKRSELARDDLVDALVLMLVSASALDLSCGEIGDGGIPISLKVPNLEGSLFSPG